MQVLSTTVVAFHSACLRAKENDQMWGQKLKSRQAKAELSVVPQSNTTLGQDHCVDHCLGHESH